MRCFEVFFAPEILNGTKAEVYEIAAESGVDYLKRLGLDIAEDVAEDVDKVAATTVCLFFGYLDGAATISESCGGEFRQYVFLSMRQVRMSNGAAY